MQQTLPSAASWLKRYYFLRAAVSFAWVALAFTTGLRNPVAGAVLLITYPAWDALANYLDARKSGGLASNKPQTVNMVVSLVTTVGVVLALPRGAGAVILVFGVWAVLSGLLQLMTGFARWKMSGAQWAIVLSGAQSILAGGFFVLMGTGPAARAAVAVVAPYAAFGAFYFLVSAIWLTIGIRPAPARA